MRNHVTAVRSPHHPRLAWSSLLFATLVVTALSLHQIANACTHPPPNPPTVVVTPVSGISNLVRVVVCDYTTFGASSNQFCACALKRVPGIAQVRSFDILQVQSDGSTVPLPGFSFQPSTATESFYNETRGGNWSGFFSRVSQAIPANLRIKLSFLVETTPGTTPTQLASALRQSAIGTSEATPNGTPTGDHLAVLSPGEVRVEPNQPSFFAFGLRHEVTGQAQVDNSPTAGLRVSNLGSSGMDGVSVNLNDADGWQGTLPLDLSDPAGGPAGQLLWRLHSQTENGGDQLVSAGRARQVGDQIHFLTDPGTSGAMAHRVDLIQNGRVVRSRVIDKATPLLYRALPPIQRPIIVITWLGPIPGRSHWTCKIFWPEPCTIVIGDDPRGPVTGGGEIVITPISTGEPMLEAHGPSRVVLAGASLSQFSLLNEALIDFDRPHFARGQAHLGSVGGKLVVSNIGSSGQDGVAVQLEDISNGFLMGFDPLLLDAPGKELQLLAVGNYNGKPNSPLGTSTLRNVNGQVQAFADFRPLEATSTRVEVYSQGTLVGSQLITTSSPQQPVALISGNLIPIRGCGKLPPRPPCFIWDIGQLVTITPLGGQPLRGDELRILAANAPAPIQSLSGFQLTGANIPSISLTYETLKADVPGQPIVLLDAEPRTLSEGQIVTIKGHGFGNNPDNLCIVARFEDTAIPLRALFANDTEVRALVGPVPPDAPPARLMVGLGKGNVGFFQPIFDDIVVEEPVWVWRGVAEGGLAEFNMVPAYRPPPGNTRWFFGRPVDGRLCTFITGNWPSNATVRVTARAHTATEKLDLDAPRTRFIGGGTTLQCAQRLQDILRCAFRQQAGTDVHVTVTPQTDGSVKITVTRWDNQPITWGMLTICVTDPAPPNQPPIVITSISPNTGTEGDLITINGRGFPNNPDDLCVVSRFDDAAVPMRAISATATQIVARVGVVPPNAKAGPIMIGVGRGNVGRFHPAFDDIVVVDPVWVWRGFDNGVLGPVFQPRPVSSSGRWQWFFGQLENGRLSTIISGNWASNTLVRVTARAHTATEKLDLDAPSTRFIGGGTLQQCAVRIGDIIRCAFRQQAGTDVNVQFTTQPDGRVKITVSRVDGRPITWGLLTICVSQPTERPVITGIWDVQNRGLWRKEVRAHEIARWYRNYTWVTDTRLWLNRRAEGVWITREALQTFTCRAHCILRNPNGPGFWRIWRTFTQTDVVRFRKHYRISWIGHLNAAAAAEQNRFVFVLDHLEMVLPMEPRDPNPATPFNEAVMIFDDAGNQHFLGERGFEVLPDTAANPKGFQLATTARSTDQLPPAALRISGEPDQPMPGMAQIQPGVIVEWLVDDNGRVLVDHDGDGKPDPLLSSGVLGNQPNQAVVGLPTGQAGAELPLDFGNTPPQLFCWMLDAEGEVVGTQPGRAVIGPPESRDGNNVAFGGPAPMDPTVRTLEETNRTVREVVVPGAQPFQAAIIEEGAPNDAELKAFNDNIARQIPGFVPLQRPFNICIRNITVRNVWGIDRRVVYDTWLHHWAWRLSHHITFKRGAYRVWLTKKTVTDFRSSHHHFVAGQPPVWTMYSLQNVRFFRVCYRVLIPAPNVVRIKIDQLHVVVPERPGDPNSPLMLLSTQGDENALFREVSPAVLAGLEPDPLPVDAQGVSVQPLNSTTDVRELTLGRPNVFGTDRLLETGMDEHELVGNRAKANELNNNQLQLYCWMLDSKGNVATERFTATGAGVPEPNAAGGIDLAQPPTTAFPLFVDEEGNTVDNPTMFDLTLMADADLLKIRRSGNNVILDWSGPASLEAGPSVRGPFVDQLLQTDPPVTMPATQPLRIFRLRR